MMLLAATLILPLLVRPIDLHVRASVPSTGLKHAETPYSGLKDPLAPITRVARPQIGRNTTLLYRVSAKKVKFGLHLKF